MKRLLISLLVALASALPAKAQIVEDPGAGGGTAFSAAVASGATYCSSATGTDAYACSLSPAPVSYASIIGVPLTFLASDVGNTGAATVSFNGLGAQAIVKVGATSTTDLVTGDIRAGTLVSVQWNGSNFECLSCMGNYANLTIANTWSQSQTFSSPLIVSDGAVGAPGFRGSSATSGVYFTNSGQDFNVTRAGTQVMVINAVNAAFAKNVIPLASNTYDLGGSAVEFKNMYYLGWRRSGAEEMALNADYTNATTTFSNTALSVSLVSGRTYNFTVNLLMSDSVAADGMKIDFNGGAATVTNFRVSCMATNDTTGATVAFTAATATALATTLNIATMASTGTHMVVCNGTIVPSSSNTFIVRAAQNAHTTGTLTITRGSWMSIRDSRPL